MSDTKGNLNVELDFLSSELSTARWPLKIHRMDSTVVAKTLTSHSISLDPGTYYVTVEMPAGQEFSEYTEVRGWSDTELKLKASPAVALGSQEANIFLGGQPVSLPPQTGWRFLWSLVRKGIGRALGKTTSRSGRLRAVRGNLLADSVETIDTIGFRPETLDQVVRLNVTIGAGPGFLQLVQPGLPTVNVAFPHTAEQPCFLYVAKPDGSPYSLEVHLEDSTADALLKYVTNGMLESATIVATWRLVTLEFQKERNAVNKIVRAYALLRLGENERLADMIKDFESGFEWLPDAAVIRGEYYARSHRHAAALAEFNLLAERGLPFFTAGFKYTLQRLESYTNAEEGPSTRPQKQAAETILHHLKRLNPYVHHEQPLLTFTGLNPLEPDDATFPEDMTHCPGYDLEALEFKRAPSIFPIGLTKRSSRSQSDHGKVERPIRTALLVFAGLFLFGISYVGLSIFRAVDGGHAGIAILWSTGIFMTAALTGFLFGIPRILSSQINSDASVHTESKSTLEETPLPKSAPQPYQVNTNLEQISDWLTKILVGLALVNLTRVPELIVRASGYMAAGLGGAEHKFLAGGMLLYFPVIGFLSSYLMTRFYLIKAFDTDRVTEAEAEDAPKPQQPKAAE